MKKQNISLALVLVFLVCFAAINAHARVSAGDKSLTGAMYSMITFGDQGIFIISGLGTFSYFITSHISIPGTFMVAYTSGGGGTAFLGSGGCRYFINPNNPKVNFYVGGDVFFGRAFAGSAFAVAASTGPWFNLTKNIFLTCDVYVHVVPGFMIQPFVGITTIF